MTVSAAWTMSIVAFPAEDDSQVVDSALSTAAEANKAELEYAEPILCAAHVC